MNDAQEYNAHRMIQSRYRQILWFFAGVILQLLWWDMVLPRLGFRSLSNRTRPARIQRTAIRFRLLAIKMGGVLIKVGQFLSARLDILPRDVTEELADLQDEVQPAPFEAIRQVIEAEINAPLAEQFEAFDPLPLASASIGQVHRARIRKAGTGQTQEVVVKVQRPNIRQIVETDLAALHVVSRWIDRYPPVRKRANMPALMDEFSRSLYEEIDYLREGRNGETFAENFKDRPIICVPKIYWNHTTLRMLTQEEIFGIKITDSAAIDAAGIDRAAVANQLFDAYLKQIFEDRFFHADPHPGNLFVLKDGETTEDGMLPWRLIFVDFGMTGTVPPHLLEGLRELLIAVGTQDVARVIRAYQKIGVLLPGADLELLEKAGQRLFERFWGKSTTEIVSMGHEEAVSFAREFGDLLYEMPFQVPENLILLGRCLSILSGICTGLNPDFNVWERVMPYARQLIEAESNGRPFWLSEAVEILQTLVSMPVRTNAVLQRIERGRLEVQMPELRRPLQRLEHGLHQLARAILFAVFFIGGVQLYLASETGLAFASAIAAGLVLLWMLLSR